MPDLDETNILLTYLQSAGIGTRIHADADTPPAGYTPADGPAYCFKLRGGQDDDTDAVQVCSFQFKCYGSDEPAARLAYRNLHAMLKSAKTFKILSARREMLGVTLSEPDTGWIFVLVYYSLMIITEA